MTTTFPTIDPRGLFGRDKAISDQMTKKLGWRAEPKTTSDRIVPSRTLNMQVAVYAQGYLNDLSGAQREFTNAILHQLNKHPRKHMPSRDRTTSKRKRAGSRKGNGRHTTERDWVNYGHPSNPLEHGSAPNHKKRAGIITSVFPVFQKA